MLKPKMNSVSPTWKGSCTEDSMLTKTHQEPETSTVVTTFSTFCGGTTAHGFSHLTTNTHIGRGFWMLILLCATIGVSIHLYAVITDYLEYKYTDAVKVLSIICYLLLF